MIALWHWKHSSVSSCPWSEWWLVHVLDDCLMALETLFSVLLSMVRMMVSTCIRWLPHWKLSSVSCPWSEWWLVHVLDDCLIGNSLQCPTVHGQNDGSVHVLDDCLMALETLFSVLLSMVRMMVSTCIRWLPHWKHSSVSCCPWSEWWLVHVLDDCLMVLETLFSVLLSMVRMMVSTCIRWLPHGIGNTLQCPTVHGQNDG